MVVSVRAFPRLHFGLLDLSGSTMRSYGGSGVSFNGPHALVRGTRDSSAKPSLLGFGDDVELRLDGVLDHARRLGHDLKGRYVLEDAPHSHVGLGSTTAVTLSLLRCMAELNGWSTTREQLIEISGRGRTSGVGCNAFFDGGLVIDAGQPGHPSDGTYLPSIAAGDRRPSLHVGSWPMPSGWSVWLLFSDRAPTVQPSQERAIFHRGVSADRDAGQRLVAALYHGVLPAVLEGNLSRMAVSMQSLQSDGLKRVEVSMQPVEVQDALQALWVDGAVAGLSSFGPVVFVITSDPAGLPTCVPPSASPRGPFTFRSRGHEIATEESG